MGQIAEDMIDGTCCSWCGEYFDDGTDNLPVHGYPVICKGCAEGHNKEELEKLGLQIASHPTI